MGSYKSKNSTSSSPLLLTQSHIDWTKYQGTWYEVARISKQYEDKQPQNVISEYKLNTNKTVEVYNRQLFDGKIIETQGTGTTIDTSNSKLIIYFPSEHKIINYYILETDYIGYSLIGNPDRSYLCLLSRGKLIDHDTYAAVLNRLTKIYGYDVNKVVLTKQS